MREKPPILSDEQIRMSCLGEGGYFAGEWDNQATAEPPKLMPQFRNVAQAQRDADLKWLREEVEKARLTDDEIKAILYNYAVDICTSMPVKSWNDTEAIQRVVEAQLQKILALLREDNDTN